MEVESNTSWRTGSGQTVCRCCLAEGCYKDISTEYFWMGKREVYSEMLLDTFDLNIGFSAHGVNSNSRLICEPCIARLRDACEFKRQVVDCEKLFMQQLEPGASGPSTSILEIDATGSGKPVKMEVVKIEKTDSDDDFDRGLDDDDDDDDLDDEPLTKFATKVPKKESAEILELLDEPKATKRKVSTKVKVKVPPVKKVKVSKKDSPKASSSKVVTAKAVVKPEKKKKDENLNDRARRNAELVLRHSTAYPFRVNVKSLLCVYCLELHEDPELFRRHMELEHQQFSSTLVFSKLPKAEFVKADLSDLRCRICDARQTGLDDLAAHLRKTHGKSVHTDSPLGVIPYLLTRHRWNCAVCSKTLPSLLHLNKHTVTHFLGFVCDICGKSYLASTGLLRHMKLKHDQDGNTSCRLCKKSFDSIEAKTQHHKTEKRCMPHRCTLCVERFPNWELKQRHMSEAHGQSKMQYRCPECGISCPERRAFYNHYRISHSQECLVCVHCGLKFATTSRLNRHLGKHAV